MSVEQSLESAWVVWHATAKLLNVVTGHLARAASFDGRVSVELLDERQVDAYRYAMHVSELTAARSALSFADRTGIGSAVALAKVMVAELVLHVRQDVVARPRQWGVSDPLLAKTVMGPKVRAFIEEALDYTAWPALSAQLLETGGVPQGLDDEAAMMAMQFRRFADDVVTPRAEHVHREDALVPEEIIEPLRELGCFGLSIPEEYGGLQFEDTPANLNMCVVTEELSRGSLGIAGSLITRPEILAKAILSGGTEDQKQEWLPKLASGERMAAVAVTEPDFGSNVAGMKVMATPVPGGYRLSGQKTWCTFGGYADVLMVLARTDADLSKGHKGLSILLVEKPRFEGHAFEWQQPALADGTPGGKMTAKAIDTIGYRGMHSFDVFFEDVFVPMSHVVGGEAGLGRGFYYQMKGFSGGRLQTAARAVGLMQAALERAQTYSKERQVFGQPIAAYPLSAEKLSRMAMLVHACRQFTYDVAAMLDAGKGQVEASMVKLWACRQAEWVAREAMQLHGGMGYAEEYDVSRYYVDARVLSIFEGAEEVLALRVVARQLLQRWLDSQRQEA